MNAGQNLRLQEWLLMGKQSSKIRETRTVGAAFDYKYCGGVHGGTSSADLFGERH